MLWNKKLKLYGFIQKKIFQFITLILCKKICVVRVTKESHVENV